MTAERAIIQPELTELIKSGLKPLVKKIDLEGFYAVQFIRNLGSDGFFTSAGLNSTDVQRREIGIIQETAKSCMTTAFCLWCHFALLTYVRHSENDKLKELFLNRLENGELLGGTGLSNPLKHYEGLEKLFLKAEPTAGGYYISGTLPSVSNIGPDHIFALIAGKDDHTQIMAIVPCSAKGVTMVPRTEYLGLNGSATFTVMLKRVFVPDSYIISETANLFIKKVRSIFISYQIPLGFGVIEESIRSIEKVENKQNGCNQYLKIQPEHLKQELIQLQNELNSSIHNNRFKELADIKLRTVYLTLRAVEASMLHQGSAAYTKESSSARRLKEAYFLANLTPTVKHLEKLLQ